MPQLDRAFDCPGCGEPYQADDRFCRACGTHVRAPGPTPAPAPPAPQAPQEPDFRLPPPERPGTALPALTPRATRDDAPPPVPGSRPPASPAGAPAQPPDPRLRDTAPPPQASPACAACGAGTVGTGGCCGSCGRSQPGDRDHVERALECVAGVSDLGLRHHRNEDAFTVSATALPDGSSAVIAVVCDGVSSSSRPHEASAAAAEAAGESLLAALPRGVPGPQAMHDAVVDASRAVDALADAEQVPGRNAPACTIVSAITAGGELTVGWVGDSRAYWLPMEGDAHPIRLTEDDSWAAQMVKAGLLSEEEALTDHRAHAITAWLGADNPELEPHTASFKPDRAGVVVVCTDGLWNYADTAERMAALVSPDARTAPLASARRLVRYALDSGGQDNVTVAVIPFPAAGAPRGRRAAAEPAPPPTATQPVTPPVPGTRGDRPR